jgi:hypothetical protein
LNTLYPTIEEIAPGGRNALDGVLAYENSAAFTYMLGDASRAYSASKMAQSRGFLRSIVFLRAPGFWPKPVGVVFDRIQTLQALPASFLLHSVNEPAAAATASAPLGNGRNRLDFAPLAARVLTVRNGGGMVGIQTLLPVNAAVVSAGGQRDGQSCVQVTGAAPPVENGDCRFTVRQRQPDGSQPWRNFPPPAGATVLTDADVGAWRIEMMAPDTPTAGAPQYFLNVMSVADNDGQSGVAPGVPAVRVGEGATEAVLLGDQLVVAFNRAAEAAGAMSWSAPSHATGFIAVGLRPNADYQLGHARVGSQVRFQLQQRAGGQHRSSPDGVLSN